MSKFKVICTVLLSVCLLSSVRAETLPTGKELIDKMVAASGGREKIATIKAIMIKSTMASAMINGTVVAYQMEDGRVLNTTTLGGMGEIKQVYDGTVGWTMNPMTGTALMSEDEVALLKRSGFKSMLNPEENYKSFEVTGSEQLDGKDVYVVKTVSKEGQEATSYIEKATSLPVQIKMTMKNPQMGEIPMTMKITEYKDFGGLKLPKTMTQEVMSQVITVTIDDVQQNAEPPAGSFDMPEDVKKLLAKKAPATQPAGDMK
jgi:outer membrane lipoprotein-sorting protein